MTPDEMAHVYQWDLRPKLPSRRPDFGSWPGGARMAVQLLMLHEWESIPRPTRPMPAGAHHTFDFLSLGIREYGQRDGFWRIMDVLDRHQAKASVLVNGLTCELFPETVREAKRRGHELACHQWDQAIHPTTYKTREEEREDLHRAKSALEVLTGEPALGYMSQGPRPTPHTLDLTAEAGFLWTADYSDSDLPYLIEVGGRKLVSVGYVAPGFTDNDLQRAGSEAGLHELLTTLDVLYEESARQPMKLCYAFHSHVTGRPVMSNLLDRFLSHVRQRPGVWLCRGIDLARFWLELAHN
ncbi:MAG TPA: polysaccharide deacetylase family protein [Chloroflexota bacterium]|nr:polysaccharide deacetylase family protein [Chloroflexota bacterium]